MKQFKNILKFELKSYFTNKIFVGVTIFLVVAIAGVMFFPRITEAFESKEDEGMVKVDNSTMLIVNNTDENNEAIGNAFSEAFVNYEVVVTDKDVEYVKQEITSGEAECAFVLNDLTSYTYYVNNLSMYDRNTMTADELLQNIYRMNAMLQGGFTKEEITAIFEAEIEGEIESLGKDQMQNFFYTYIMIFSLYMVILFYGQMVATNVATEKSSRAMELLITSAKPTNMMFGKIIASCIAGLIQIVAIFGSALLFFNLNSSYWADSETINSIFNMPVNLFAYMLIFFILGFFIYAFMYGAVGSTASKLEDINTSVMPITLMFIISFLVVMFSMTSAGIDNPIMKVCSFIPFTSPMAMFTRIAMSTVPFYEVCISIAILVGSVIGVGVIAAKIYRVGVLLYGTTPKIGTILKSIWKA